MATDEFISICGVLIQYKGNSKNITIPDGVETIGPHAFGRCEKLETICLPASLKKLSKNSFHLCDNLTIYAPKGSYAESCAKIMNIPFDTM